VPDPPSPEVPLPSDVPLPEVPDPPEVPLPPGTVDEPDRPPSSPPPLPPEVPPPLVVVVSVGSALLPPPWSSPWLTGDETGSVGLGRVVVASSGGDAAAVVGAADADPDVMVVTKVVVPDVVVPDVVDGDVAGVVAAMNAVRRLRAAASSSSISDARGACSTGESAATECSTRSIAAGMAAPAALRS